MRTKLRNDTTSARRKEEKSESGPSDGYSSELSYESENSMRLLKKREMGDRRTIPAVKIEVFNTDHPKHNVNSIKHIPLVMKNKYDQEYSLKNMAKAR